MLLHDVSTVLPHYLQRAVPHQTFNRIQSECLEAWTSDENLLVSAPTGSGKTVCFELGILRHVHKALEFSDIKRLDSNGFSGKAVFIAPTKALCAEKREEWRKKFGFIGLRVESVTGDDDLPASESRLGNVDLILTTAEKWDSVTRNVVSYNAADFTSQVSLLLLDEVHQVGDSRGAVFESVVTRMLVASDESKRTSPSLPASHLRVIAVSATVGNVHEVGKWLRVRPDHVKVFDASYRPVDLEFKVLGFNIRNRWQASKVYDSRMLQVLRQFGMKKPTLVFCSSRRQTVISAKALVDSLKSTALDQINHGNGLTCHLSEEQRRKLFDSALVCRDKVLASLIPSGVAIHNAEMSLQNRRLVENLFRESLIQCLFSTSTLAQGVNLPARLVVIAGTAVYHDGALKEYDLNMLLQMCGRAGRVGLDSKGVVIIMTAASTATLYENIGKTKPATIESQLVSHIEECFNAEIARQYITDVPSAVSFLRNTFFWVREERSINRLEEKEEHLDSRATSIAMKTINRLAGSNLIFYDEDHFGLSSTVAGKYMAKYYLSYSTIKHLIEEIPSAFSPLQILRVIASTADVLKDVFIRRTEKKKLNEWKENLRLPVREKVKDATDKIVILLQMVMGDQLNSSHVEFSFRSEALRILQSASRICWCVISLALDRGLKVEYASLYAILQVCRGLPNRTFWDGPTVLRQIPAVTASHARLLAKKGVFRIEALAALGQNQIDNIIAANSPVGQNILEHLRTFPHFHLETKVHRDPACDNRVVQIDVHVTLCAQIGHWGLKQRRGERGFVLVGSHATGLIDIRTFGMDVNECHFGFQVPPCKDLRLGKWIDIYVGPENIVGIDKKATIRLDAVDADFGKTVLPSKRVSLQNSFGPSPGLHVPKGRISKRSIQTTLSEVLTRDVLIGRGLGTPSERLNERRQGESLRNLDTVLTEQRKRVSYVSQQSSDPVRQSYAPKTEFRAGRTLLHATSKEGQQDNTGDEGSAGNHALINIENKEFRSSHALWTNSNAQCFTQARADLENAEEGHIARQYDDTFKNLF